MATSHENWREQLGLTGRRPSEFFSSHEEIDRDDDPPPQAHVMRRAWVDMGLDGILCFDGIPVVYFKEVEEIDDDEARDLQRKLWNQGIAPLLLLITPWHVHVYSGLALPAKEGEPVSGKKWLVDTLDRVSDALELRTWPVRSNSATSSRSTPTASTRSIASIATCYRISMLPAASSRLRAS